MPEPLSGVTPQPEPSSHDTASAHTGAEPGPPQVTHNVIDDIPVYWDNSPDPLVATVIFRVGQADETLRHSGLTHLVEHLTLFGVNQAHSEYNGDVGQLITTFRTTGSDDEVISWITQLGRSLAMLPPDRLAFEIEVVRGERPHTPSWTSRHLSLRFGVCGYGLVACEELGLCDATIEKVDTWRRSWFNASNVAVVFNREPPDGLDLSSLPEGVRKPVPLPHPVTLPLPAYFTGEPDSVSVSFIAPDEPLTRLVLELFQLRLVDRLRDEDAVSSQVLTAYQQLGDGNAAIACYADAVPGHAAHVRAAIASELFHFGMTEPTQEQIDAVLESQARRIDDSSESATSGACGAAIQHLLGLSDDAEGVDRASEIPTPSHVASAARRLPPSAIWLVPPGIAIPDLRVVRIPDGSPTSVTGNAFIPVAHIAWVRQSDRLIVGTEGITLLVSEMAPVTVEFAECVLLQVWSDGARTLWNADGVRFLIHPTTWQGGDQVISWIDSQVEQWLTIDMTRPSGYSLPTDATAASPGR